MASSKLLPFCSALVLITASSIGVAMQAGDTVFKDRQPDVSLPEPTDPAVPFR